VKKDGNFYVRRIFGEEEDIFLCDDSENPGDGLVRLQYTKNGTFYASASFMKHPFHRANFLIATDGKSLLRSRYYLHSPELIGRVNKRIYFYARNGFQSYVFFHIDLDTPLQ
jgi:hypothetical protein